MPPRNNLPTVFLNRRSPFWWSSWYGPNGREQRSLQSLGLTRAKYTKEQALEILLNHLGVTDDSAHDLKWFLNDATHRARREGLRDSTIHEYDVAIKLLSGVMGETTPIEGVTRQSVIQFQDALLKKGTAPITVNKYCSTIRAAFDRLVDAEMIPGNPFRKFRRLRHIPRGPQSLTRKQFSDLMEALADTDQRYARLLHISAFLGIRRTEVMNLRREGINIEAGQILTANNKRHARADRLIYFDPAIRDDLKWFLETSKTDTPMHFCSPNHFTKWVKKLFRKLGFPESLHLHSLRHTWTTFAIESGVDMWLVQRHLDHATIRTTEGYAHPDASLHGPIIIFKNSEQR